MTLPTYKGGVVDENQNFVTGFCRRNPGDQFSFDINEGYNVEKNNLVHLNEEVVFGGVLVGHFGHIILECFSRLWWHIKNPNSTVKFAFLSIWERKKWFRDFFDLLGIEEERIIFIDKPTQFINVICPEQSIYSWKGYKKEYIEIYKKIREKIKIEDSNKKKIYLTKSKFDNNTCIGEKYFEDFYRCRGFEIIAPESLSIAEQISLVANAEEVVTTVGTLSHFVVFCDKSTKFIILNKYDEYTLLPQIILNQASKVDYKFVDVCMNYLYTARVAGVYLLGPTKYWRLYLDNEKIPYTEDEVEIDMSNKYLEYLRKWIQYYTDPVKFKKIQNISIYDILKPANKFFFNKKIDQNRYLRPNKQIDLRFELGERTVLSLETYFHTIDLTESIVILSVKDEASKYKNKIPVNYLGIKADYGFRQSYICIIDFSEKFVYEKASDELIEYEYNVFPTKMTIVVGSGGYNSKFICSKICINGIDYSSDKRGLNIVVISKSTMKVIDSVNCDLYKDSTGTVETINLLEILENNKNNKIYKLIDYIEEHKEYKVVNNKKRQKLILKR